MSRYLIIITAYLLPANLAFRKGPDVHYCDFPCETQKSHNNIHTICRLKHNSEVSPKCIKFKNLPLTDNEKKNIVPTNT